MREIVQVNEAVDAGVDEFDGGGTIKRKPAERGEDIGDVLTDNGFTSE